VLNKAVLIITVRISRFFYVKVILVHGHEQDENVSLSFVLLKQSFVLLSTHISFTVCLNWSIERIGIKMIYFAGHICF